MDIEQGDCKELLLFFYEIKLQFGSERFFESGHPVFCCSLLAYQIELNKLQLPRSLFLANVPGNHIFNAK